MLRHLREDKDCGYTVRKPYRCAASGYPQEKTKRKEVKTVGETILGNTQFFTTRPEQEMEVREVLDYVYNAMEEKGYNPVNLIVGYIMSGDPTYITSHKGARSMIMKVERDELVEELLQEYIRSRDHKDA